MRVSTETKIEDIKLGSMQRPNILVAIPTLGSVPIEFVIGCMRMSMPSNGTCPLLTVKGMEIGIARNFIVEQAYKMTPRPKYIFMLGDDMIAPWNGLIELYEEMERGQWDLLTGLYYVKQEPPTPLLRRDGVGWLKAGIHFEVGEVVWVDLTGLDFTLIRTDLFEKLTKPYFKTGPTLEDDGSINNHTEDFWMMRQARKVGARIGVHTGVRIAHLDVKTGAIY